MASNTLFYATNDPEEASQRLRRLADTNKQQNESRRLLAAKYGSLYEGLNLNGLAPYGYSSNSEHYFEHGKERIPIIRNACHSIVDTFVSKIGALTSPRPSMMTTDGSWAVRRQAKKLEELLLPEYDQPQGWHSNLDELYQQALRITAAATGSTAIKVKAYPDEGKISHEIHDTLTMFFDHGELTYSGMLTLGEITWYDVDRLVLMYPEKAETIRSSVEKPPQEFRGPARNDHERTPMVALYEGWRVTVGSETGKYVAAVKAGNLEFEDYDYPRPPFVWLVIDPHLYGVLGHSMTHHMYESIRRDNLITAMIDRSVSKSGRGLTLVDKDQLEDPEGFDVIEDNDVVGVKGNYKPDFVSPIGFHPAHLQVADRHFDNAHETTGMSRAHTGSVREIGLPSAQAQRQVAAKVNERFAAGQKRYVHAMAVDNAKLMVQALREVHAKKAFTRNWPDSKFLKEISSDILDLDDKKYSVKYAPVSGKTHSPEGRAQSAFELFQLGILSEDGYAAVQENGFDLPAEMGDRDSEQEWIEKQMFGWMHESEETIAEPDFYQSPIKFMNLERALSMVVRGLVEAMMEDLEDDRLEFFLMFLADLDAAFQQKAQFVESATPTEGAAPSLPGQVQPPTAQLTQ